VYTTQDVFNELRKRRLVIDVALELKAVDGSSDTLCHRHPDLLRVRVRQALSSEWPKQREDLKPWQGSLHSACQKPSPDESVEDWMRELAKQVADRILQRVGALHVSARSAHLMHAI
jgi:hypothetical protein